MRHAIYDDRNVNALNSCNMSIVFGCINLGKQDATPAVIDSMASTLTNYKFDRFTKLLRNNVAMGYFNQYATAESAYDELPFYDKALGLFFLCDGILDNRNELINLLGLESATTLPDSSIIFEAYKKWGRDCATHLLGDFAFIVYDEAANKVLMFRDHMGKRLIYYKLVKDNLFFSTLFKPLIDPFGNGQKSEINEQYLVEFLSIAEIRHEITPSITIYKDISYVLPGGLTTVGCGQVENSIYWDPTQIKVNHNYNEKNFIEEFNSIFFEAVRCRLRTSGEIGILLSGGLDSSAVGCVAASLLRDRGKSLNTYTSVPVQGFKNWAPAYYCPDESPSVLKMREAYPNMNVHFVDSEGLNSVNVIDRVLSEVEQPYKFIDNSYWLTDIYQKASQDGCKVLLSGVNGNTTISFGLIDSIFLEHLLRLDFRHFFGDFASFCAHNHAGRKKTMVMILREVFGYLFEFDKYDPASPLVKQEYRRKYDVKKHMCHLGYSNKPVLRHRSTQLIALHPTFRNHMNSVSTKTSLANNVCDRDPTSDKRVVEFCMQLPYHLYFDPLTGLDRGLIRQSMQGIVPAEILYDRHRGLQSADWLDRIDVPWEPIVRDLSDGINRNSSVFKYIDADYFLELIDSMPEQERSFDIDVLMRSILSVYICMKFEQS